MTLLKLMEKIAGMTKEEQKCDAIVLLNNDEERTITGFCWEEDNGKEIPLMRVI